MESAWGFIFIVQVSVTSSADHFSMASSLGYLEGYLTCETMKTFYPNFYSAVFGSKAVPGSETLKFLEDNYQWMRTQADLNYENDEQWYSVNLLLYQLDGMLRGVTEGCPSTTSGDDDIDYTTLDNPTLMHLLLLNAWGDLYQITAKYFEPGRPRGSLKKGNHMNDRRDLRESTAFVERCSAIIKLLPNYDDVVYGHATWDTFESLGPRIFKHVSLPLRSQGSFNQPYDVYFSSSPGLLSSVDDFFTVSGE